MLDLDIFGIPSNSRFKFFADTISLGVKTSLIAIEKATF